MMSSEDLRNLCIAVRQKTAPVDEHLVERIEQDVLAYRDVLRARATQLPPDDLAGRLPLIGWLIYEASLMLLWDVKTLFGDLPEADKSRANADLIERLADAGRALPWPEHAPRALGATRAQALVESKRDTVDGYDAAWTLHEEARTKHQEYLDAHGDSPGAARFVLDLEEVLLQLALAETGTACRTAEQTIGRWIENWEHADPGAEGKAAGDWVRRLFRQLSEGADVGERALGIADRIFRQHGFVDRISEERMVLRSGFRNPAIMTCRALLLMYSLGPAMERLGARPPGHDKWEDFQASLRVRFHSSLAYLRRPVTTAEGGDVPLLKDHARAIVQFCLHLALMTADETLAEPYVVDETLTLHRLDDDAAEAMARWLAEPAGPDGKLRGDANLIGSASMPHFIHSVECCRVDEGAAADYRRWRAAWPQLDRYYRKDEEPGRWARIEAMVDRNAEGGIW